MLPLVPFAMSILPQIGKWLFSTNAKAAEATQAVAGVVQAVTGGDPTTAAGMAAIHATLAAQPDLGIDLQLKLAELHATLQAAEDKAAADALASRLADVANARSQTVALAQAHSAVAWAAPVMSVAVVVGFFAVLLLLISGYGKGLDPQVLQIVNITVGTLAAGFTAVIGYWLGSSAGSTAKNDTIANMGNQLAASTPVVTPTGK
jgi:hypothetical protein